MSTTLSNHTLSPPELPSYLKSVHDLKKIVGVPSDEELIGILSMISVAQKAAEVPGMGDSVLISQLSQHLFDAQMVRYRSRYLATTFPENMVYNPPDLPNHVSVQLESITGPPSEDDVIKVHAAIRLYQQFSNVATMFDPRVHMELSQHLFDIQMAKHIQRARQTRINPTSHEIPTTNVARDVERVADAGDGNTNNLGMGADSNTITSIRPVQVNQDPGIRDAIERSNRLAEQANQLIERSNQLTERSNQIAERGNQLVELSSHPAERSNNLTERFNDLFGRLNQHLEKSNCLTEELTKPVEKVGEILKNINRVLARIQHAIIRNHKGNTLGALDCLVNEEGETPAMSITTRNFMFSDFLSENGPELSVKIDGILLKHPIPDQHLSRFLRFYGVASAYFENESTDNLLPGIELSARNRLGEYLSSCLG